jgi:hypothetical protein
MAEHEAVELDEADAVPAELLALRDACLAFLGV